MDSSSGLEEASKTEKTTSQRWLTLEEEEEEEEGEVDDAAWETLNESFKEVQKALDKNRLLIQQVNQNHQSKIHDNLVKNVELIQEINGNISKDCGDVVLDMDWLIALIQGQLVSCDSAAQQPASQADALFNEQ